MSRHKIEVGGTSPAPTSRPVGCVETPAQVSAPDRANPACPICNDQYVVAVAGPDENGQYDTEDCPCQVLPENG